MLLAPQWYVFGGPERKTRFRGESERTSIVKPWPSNVISEKVCKKVLCVRATFCPREEEEERPLCVCENRSSWIRWIVEERARLPE